MKLMSMKECVGKYALGTGIVLILLGLADLLDPNMNFREIVVSYLDYLRFVFVMVLGWVFMTLVQKVGLRNAVRLYPRCLDIMARGRMQ